MDMITNDLAVSKGDKPFSALIQCMRTNNEAVHQVKNSYDEFGFEVSKKGELKVCKEQKTSSEESKHLLQWQAYLEFTLNSEVKDLTWSKIGPSLPRTAKLVQLVHSGIPHRMRPQIWMRLSGGLKKKLSSKVSYDEMVVACSSTTNFTTAKAIEKDLLRTIPHNACFSTMDSIGIPKLRRILRTLAWLYPDNGYCQGVGMIISHLLLFLEEQDAFWVTCAVIEDLVPSSYFGTSLTGVQIDQRVLRQLIGETLPSVDKLLSDHDIELSLITVHWFITLFAGVVSTNVLLRVWDHFFLDGSIAFFRISLALLKIKESDLISLNDSAEIFNLLSDIPSLMDDPDLLLQTSRETAESLTVALLNTHRDTHHANLVTEFGDRLSAESQVSRKQVIRRRSFIGKIFSGSYVDENFENLKVKNIRQTQLISDLKQSIANIINHFRKLEPQCDVDMNPDYSPESHLHDHDDYMNVSIRRRQRAKALLDFEKNDDDELGFQKNDIITILSMRDEHCWVGERNGVQGWFPAKFVELLDERSKTYSVAGDGNVDHSITDLVRGGLCPALAAIFEHGLRRPVLLGTACHFWQFIEEAAAHEVEKDFDSVFSRLVLCKTFRLDEDGKVLTPEELLYRSVQAVDMSHNSAHAQMDVKFRSLLCYGLNEQVLHLWLEVLCSDPTTVKKWYHPWSFLLSPGWVQIKCELRLLSKFTFYLPPDSELPPKKETSESLKEGVRDMLVKHHLFSWDL